MLTIQQRELAAKVLVDSQLQFNVDRIIRKQQHDQFMKDLRTVRRGFAKLRAERVYGKEVE